MRRCLEENDDFVRLIFLPPYSPFLKPAEWLWRNGKAEMRRIFRRPTRIYFRRRVMLVYESPEIAFVLSNTLFRDLGKILPAQHSCGVIYDPDYTNAEPMLAPAEANPVKEIEPIEMVEP